MGERILVVDDDLDSLKLIGLMLQRNGYEVSAANTGAQALMKAGAEQPDLIILDVMMPDMNGYDVCRRLRANAETKQIPIIMFTAKTLIDDKVAGFEAGADDYLTKPTHPSELASRVKAILSRTAHRRQRGRQNVSIGLIGAKGGVGTTTLALNLATARVLAGENAVLADFRLGAGIIGLSLGFPQAAGMASILAHTAHEITPRLVESQLVAHNSGLRALTSSTSAREMQQNVSTDAAVATVRALRQLGRPLVVDLGCGHTPINGSLLREMDQIILVSDNHPISLMMARELGRELASWDDGGADHLHFVIVNRSQPAQQLALADIERLAGHPVRAMLAPGAELILQALQARVPAVIAQPAAMYSSQVIKLAEEISARLQDPGRSVVFQ